MKMEVDTDAFSKVMKSAIAKNVDSLVSKLTNVDAAWKAFADKVINLIANTMDPERKDMIMSGAPQAKHPLAVMLTLMRDIGDHAMAKKMLEDYKAEIMPPTNCTDLSEGSLVISGDSVLAFRRSKKSPIMPEKEIRSMFGYSFRNEKWLEYGQEKT